MPNLEEFAETVGALADVVHPPKFGIPRLAFCNKKLSTQFLRGIQKNKKIMISQQKNVTLSVLEQFFCFHCSPILYFSHQNQASCLCEKKVFIVYRTTT